MRRGATLVELIVVLAIVGVLAAVAGFAGGAPARRVGASRIDSLAAARARAIASGRPVVAGSGAHRVRLLPDGRAIGGDLDPLTGAPRDAAR